MEGTIDLVANMTDDQIIESELLNLGLDKYEWLYNNKLYEETDDILLAFLLISSRRYDIAIEEEDKLIYLTEIVNTRLKEIINILDIDQKQLNESLNHMNDIMIRNIFLYFFHLEDHSTFYKMINHIMCMEGKNLKVCIKVLDTLMENVIGNDNEDMLRVIIDNENWIALKEILDNMLIENPNLLDIIYAEYSESNLLDYY